jgi:hypothetical protein
VRALILNALDLPAKDMPVRERGFRHEGERLTHLLPPNVGPFSQEGLSPDLFDPFTQPDFVFSSILRGKYRESETKSRRNLKISSPTRHRTWSAQ